VERRWMPTALLPLLRLPRLLPGLARHPWAHQPGERIHSRPPEMAVGDVFQRLSSACHSVWDRVVPDIPDFCREHVAAIAEG
jgi:hypothetical protein